MITARRDAAIFATLVVALIILVAVVARKRSADNFCASCGGDDSPKPALTETTKLRRGKWEGGRGPYNLQLYDSPHYYPYYETRDYMSAWDKNGRCAAYCSASEDGGCAVVCR